MPNNVNDRKWSIYLLPSNINCIFALEKYFEYIMKRLLFPLVIMAGTMMLASCVGQKNPSKTDTEESTSAPSSESVVEPLSDSIVTEALRKLSIFHSLQEVDSMGYDQYSTLGGRILKEFVALDTLHERDMFSMPFFYPPQKAQYVLKDITFGSIQTFVCNDSAKASVYLLANGEEVNLVKLTFVNEEGRWKVDDYYCKSEDIYRCEHVHSVKHFLDLIIERRMAMLDDSCYVFMNGKPVIDEYLHRYPASQSVATPHLKPFVVEGSELLADEVIASGLNVQRIRELYYAVGHTFDSCQIEGYFVPALADLITEAWAIPNDEIDGLGSWEDLYSLSDRDIYSGERVPFCFRLKPVTEDSAFVSVRTLDGDEGTHTLHDWYSMEVVRQEGRWVISHFQDDSFLPQYIANMRAFFTSPAWTKRCEEYLENMRKARNNEQERLQRDYDYTMEQYKKYFEKYPIKQ